MIAPSCSKGHKNKTLTSLKNRIHVVAYLSLRITGLRGGLANAC